MNEKEQLVKAIVEWCSKEGQAESPLLYPDPQHYVFTFPLFDMLVEKAGVTKEQIDKWFTEAQEKLERELAAERKRMARRRVRRVRGG